MIECPNCRFQNMNGAAFCAECGVTLVPSHLYTTQKMDVEHLVQAAEPRPAPIPSPAAPSDNWATLHLLDTGQMLPLATRNEFTLGRVTDGQPVMPDIDLTPYQAYAHGVSRLHAAIKRGLEDIYLMDLESANGTFINGRRLESNEERPLSNGDVVALGGLKIQILLGSR